MDRHVAMPVQLDEWMTRLEARHLANLRFAEVSRAVRALSSAYVERRDSAIAAGRVLDSAGKRAAFALYYGPLHFVATWHVLESLGVPRAEPGAGVPVLDLGCGTGAVGAAAAMWTGASRVHGIDVHPWALDEARHTYASFGLEGSVSRTSVAHMRRPTTSSLVVAGYVANELPEREREALKRALIDARRHAAGLLLIEPLSGRAAPWWPEWVDAFAGVGARAATWTLGVTPPDLAMRLGRAAGLTPTAIKLRTIHAAVGDPVK